MRNTKNHRKLFSLTVFLLSGFVLLRATNADPFSSPSLSRPGLSSPDSSLALSENMSIWTNYTENTSDAGMGQNHGSADRIARIAKAYLDYTFLSRRSTNLDWNLQGRVGVVSKSADGPNAPLSPPGQFRVLDTGLYDPIDSYAHGVSGYGTDSSFLASLEWRLNAPGFADRPAFRNLTWGDVLQVSFFADYGKTLSRASMPIDAMWIEPCERQLSGAGFGTGLSFSLPGRLTANLKAAYPAYSWDPNGGTGMNGTLDRDGSGAEYWFDFSYDF
ncbi:MAG: hypothetical protein BECKG1743D_GA0114223_109501 [Candidatus Kentron sp. G]|nr:MAG: hypothetical protein BECKG1743F_GA0114225_109651 [Candidatus Kentron sp. G]VFN06031.1 MAG: hypothetical protein BECKG1743E_GA0114224_109542 [Candidatus Kentron sp. G]VFN06980.1 MAG: hypothetical protein BECKG1743D_GA0114223_109501 [Candidatus Kentron sp. G]